MSLTAALSCRAAPASLRAAASALGRRLHVPQVQQPHRPLRSCAACTAQAAEPAGGETAAAVDRSASSCSSSSNEPPPQLQHGAIELVVGPMFAGKSTELLRRVRAYEARGLRVAVVKSDRDTRYGDGGEVITHDGLKRPCYAAASLAAFRAAAGATAYAAFQVIAVDEAQFFPDLREFCTHAADHEHKRLILAGLDGDFQRRRFGQVLDLLPLADSVTKLSARCKYCAEEAAATAGQQQQLGQLQQHQLGQGQQQHASSAASAAVFSLRLVATADGRQELVGGADVYAPVCRRHYVQLAGVGAGEGGAAAVQQQGSSSAGGGGGA